MSEEQPTKPQAAPANAFAVAALVLGVVGLVLTVAFKLAFACDVMAVVFGALGMARAREGARDGGLAKAGMILGMVGLGILLVIVLLFNFTDFGQHHLWRFGRHMHRFS